MTEAEERAYKRGAVETHERYISYALAHGIDVTWIYDHLQEEVRKHVQSLTP